MAESILKKEQAILGAMFMKIYSNLPLDERTQVVVVFNNEPISWELARNEIINNSEKSGQILKKLRELKII